MAVYQDVRVLAFHNTQAGIREKFVYQAINGNTPLVISHNGQSMTIQAKDIKSRIVGKTNYVLEDRLGGEPNCLIYFKWQPDKKNWHPSEPCRQPAFF